MGGKLQVDTESEPELFWGLRGGGGNFGIATGFTYDLHPVGPLVLGGPVYWPLEQAPLVLRFLRDFAPVAPDDLGIMIVAHQAPPLLFLPPEAYGTPAFGLLVTWAGDIAEGMRMLAPLLQVGRPLRRIGQAGALPRHPDIARRIRCTWQRRPLAVRMLARVIRRSN